MYEFWYDYMKPKYQNNAKLCYIGIKSFIIYINIYIQIFTRILLMIWKRDLTLQMMNAIDHCLQVLEKYVRQRY